ncbi:VWA domain-containing protein [Neptuniibacter sp.]|uniref:VWA domain-containing protein n=1 Tax=Neptuniibacter sp. TaxID=1962643 RepID=UPI00260BA040|nr:VWA domain-containing protein [Neptuniibacter sp.]MCP4598043.1 VWA domain-containing protein [Neptuniibacter sp.]
MLSDLQLQQPLWLLVMPVALLLTLWLQKRSTDAQDWSEVCDPELLPLLKQQGAQNLKRRWLPWSLFIAVLLLALAATQPVWQKQPQPVFKQSDALVIALDLSASMNAMDLKPSRLQRANFKIKDLLNKLPDTEIALIVYAGDAFAVTPLTEDSDTILAALPAMTPDIMPVQGSRADRALVLADQMLAQANIQGGNILLVSDEVSPAQVAADASRIRSQGRRISILAVGTATGAPVPTDYGLLKDQQGQQVIAKTDISLMQEAAGLGGGQAQLIRVDDLDIDYLIAGLQSGENTVVDVEKEIERWVAEGPWFVLIALPFLLPLFRRGLFNLLLPGVLIGSVGVSQPAHADWWQDLWKTRNQQATDVYQQGEKGAAAELFTDPRWKQLSYYENGEYQQALESLPKPETANDWYNHGNTLAKLGTLDKAVEAYDKALSQQPDFEDAVHNRKLVEDLLKQQEEKQQQKQDQQQQQGGDQNQKGQSDQQKKEEESDQESKENQSNSSEQSSDQQQDQKEQSSSSEQQQSEQQKEQQAQQMAEQLKQQLDEKLQNTEKPEQMSSSPEQEKPLDEAEQSNQQMLNRIEDDPAGLWRRKFIYQYRQRSEQQAGEDKLW